MTDYGGSRTEIAAEFGDNAWNTAVPIRRTLSEMKPHVEQVTRRKSTAIEAEQADAR